ncbi:MAG: DUF3887 domain-containing protein [Candidatus Rifleibacteriota bacterium]
MKRIVLLTFLLFSVCATAEVCKLDMTAGKFVENLADGKFAEATNLFTDQATEQLPEQRLKDIWESLTTQMGAFIKIYDIRNADTDSLSIRLVKCDFELSGLNVRLVFTENAKVAGINFQPSGKHGWRQPDYVFPEQYQDLKREIATELGPLAARLSMPVSSKPVPGVVLVHGSGPHDMDLAVGPNKPFRDISAGLASRGIAVLTYDKRTKTYGTLMKKFTIKNETTDDAVNAAKMLAEEPGIDPEQIYVLGLSQGAYALAQIAERFPQGCGWISMAGHNRPVEELILGQMEHVFEHTEITNEESEQHINRIKEQVELVRSRKFTADTPASELPLGFSADWFLSVQDYKPAEKAAKIPGRWLFMQGGRDYQVTVADLNDFREAFKNNSNAQFIVYDSLNHLFYSGEGICLPAEYSRPGSVAPEVINDIANFILQD